MTKRFTSTTLQLSIALLISGSAFASAKIPMFRPYVGVDASYLHQFYPSSITERFNAVTVTYSPSSLNPNNFLGLGFNTGFRYGDYYGLEFGFVQYANKTETHETSKITMHPRTLYFKMRGYYPIRQFELTGIAGVQNFSLGKADVENTVTGATSTLRSDSDISPLIGIGVGYHYNQNWGARLETEYDFVNSHYNHGSITTNLGVFYLFN